MGALWQAVFFWINLCRRALVAAAANTNNPQDAIAYIKPSTLRRKRQQEEL